MACDKPTGDCTNVSPCGSGGCGGCSGAEAPILPKCQDVSLTPGVFTNATVTVNAQGCISAVASGEPELYTPDECCGGGSGGGGSAGARGPKGDPGAAATVDVVTTIDQSGTSWKVENIGTTSAAVFKFTAPANTGGGGGGAGGATGSVGGLEVIDGAVVALPGSIVSDVEVVEAGQNTALFEFIEVPTATVGGQKISLNLDALVSKIDAADASLQTEIDALELVVANLNNEVVTLKQRVTDLETEVANIGSLNYGFDSTYIWNNSGQTITVQVNRLDGGISPNIPVATGSAVSVTNLISSGIEAFFVVDGNTIGYVNSGFAGL